MMQPMGKSPSPAESGTDRTEEQQEIAPSELSNEPSTSGTSTAPSEPTTTSIDLTAKINNAVAGGLIAASEGLIAASEALKAAAEALKDVKDKPESTTPITLGNLFKQDMIAANILPYYPNSSENPPEYLINKEKYPIYYMAVEGTRRSQLLYPGQIFLIAGNEFPILMDEQPSANLMAHWKKWLPQFPEPRFKTIVEGIEDEDQIVTVFPMENIPEEKHAVDPDKHYHVLLKSAIPDAGAPHPEYLKEEDINRVFPCMVKVDQSFGGYGNYKVYTPEQLEDVLEKIKNDFGEEVPYVITELVEDVKETLGCLFYLNKKGEVLWLGASLNVFKDNAWDGCEVDWDLNEYYRERVYDSFIKPVAKYLHKKRYFGIAGIDIITSPSGDYLVDINARITGCFPHVLIAREMARKDKYKGMTKSLFEKCGSHKCSTEELVEKANDINEVNEGKILILNSLDDEEGCNAAIVAFGKTEADFEVLFKKLTGKCGWLT